VTEKPEPIVDVWNKPFWDACREGRLMLQRCRETGQCWYPPSPVSPYAPRAGWEWVDCSGRGEILSFVVFHQKYYDGFAGELPYNVTMVRLAEGAQLLTNVTADNDALAVGKPVEVVFEDRGRFNVPVFRLAAAP
jgi:uncharacterized OB-fold protein